MQNIKHSRRAFLRSGALLTISSMISIPTLSIANTALQNSESIGKPQIDENPTLSLRSDIRSLDFDSHAFRLNFKY